MPHKLNRVLAFDPGYERLGAAVVEKRDGKDILLYSACIRTPKELSFPKRLHRVGAEARALMEAWAPDAVALEEVYFSKNEKTAMKIAEVRGVLTFLAQECAVTLCQYTPQEVKIATTGYGKSDKRAVSAMVHRLLALPPKKRLDDELDAIAIALTCLAAGRIR